MRWRFLLQIATARNLDLQLTFRHTRRTSTSCRCRRILLCLLCRVLRIRERRRDQLFHRAVLASILSLLGCCTLLFLTLCELMYMCVSRRRRKTAVQENRVKTRRSSYTRSRDRQHSITVKYRNDATAWYSRPVYTYAKSLHTCIPYSIENAWQKPIMQYIDITLGSTRQDHSCKRRIS